MPHINNKKQQIFLLFHKFTNDHPTEPARNSNKVRPSNRFRVIVCIGIEYTAYVHHTQLRNRWMHGLKVMFAKHICRVGTTVSVPTNEQESNNNKKKPESVSRAQNDATGTLKIEQLSWRRNRPNALSHPLKSSAPH